MKSSSRKIIIVAIAIILIGLLVIYFNLRNSGENGITHREEIDKNAPETNLNHSSGTNNVRKKSADNYLAKISPKENDSDYPIISSSDEKFWRSESPDQSKVIVFNTHSHKFDLTDKEKKNTVSISNCIKINGTDYEIVKWAWKDNNTLLAPGWSDLNKDSGVERQDVGDVKLFIYKYGASQEPEAISGPPVSLNKRIRLEGFSKDGHIILAEVFPDGYKRYGMMVDGEKIIGAFEIMTTPK